MTSMKKQLLLVLLALMPMMVSAEEVEIDGLWYNLVSKAKFAELIQYKNSEQYSGELVIPTTVVYEEIEYDVTIIASRAFYNCKGLTSIVIPNSISSIGSDAFLGCDNLNAVYITDIKEWCSISFSSMYSNPLVIAHDLYLNNEQIENLVIPNFVTEIADYAFAGSSFISVAIPNSMETIGESAFQECYSLNGVYISDIEAWCRIFFFNYLSNPLCYSHHLYMNGEEIKDLVVPNSITKINNFTFEECYGLTSLTIPNNVTSIGNEAFAGCSGLTSLNIPNSVTSIGNGAFEGCSGLTSLTIPNSITTIDEFVFSGCSGLTSVTIPNNVTSIGFTAFGSCSGLTSVIIPNSVISIGNEAFGGCSGLTSLTIPNSVTSIGDYAFSSCSSLISVTISNRATSIGEGAFGSCI